MKSATIYRFQVLFGLTLLAAGTAKLAGVDMMVRQFDIIGFGQWFRPVAGSLEVIGGLSLLVPCAAAYGAALLVCVMIGSAGAVVGHLATVARALPATEVPRVSSARYYRVELTPAADSTAVSHAHSTSRPRT